MQAGSIDTFANRSIVNVAGRKHDQPPCLLRHRALRARECGWKVNQSQPRLAPALKEDCLTGVERQGYRYRGAEATLIGAGSCNGWSGAGGAGVARGPTVAVRQRHSQLGATTAARVRHRRRSDT